MRAEVEREYGGNQLIRLDMVRLRLSKEVKEKERSIKERDRKIEELMQQQV